ncbi:ATP-dependent DNA ligase [Rathayibacter sp. VKM Ac-2804]|uniref:DUF7882 family protein n=1 Tax=unclassified Rathayibacter TaxID=2609250 RepID=UPI00132EFBBD|nr:MULTISPECIES: ATP-dependent DNA ligase [unclassified Rathayibacter]NRG42652.1 ATP-dependent DNA ligase [Rathayibacter sp. VKM Ac-2835]QHF24577.1 ATP-dependent DNA ligase [Rathayibacter sp. VKM Ac-2804]
MGRLVYNSSYEVDFEDRLLAHLKIVIGAKLGRNEGFFFSWKDSLKVGNGRTTLWMHPTIPLRFTFLTGATPPINSEWVRRLIADSHGGTGLRISSEVPPVRAAG